METSLHVLTIQGSNYDYHITYSGTSPPRTHENLYYNPEYDLDNSASWLSVQSWTSNVGHIGMRAAPEWEAYSSGDNTFDSLLSDRLLEESSDPSCLSAMPQLQSEDSFQLAPNLAPGSDCVNPSLLSFTHERLSPRLVTSTFEVNLAFPDGSGSSAHSSLSFTSVGSSPSFDASFSPESARSQLPLGSSDNTTQSSSGSIFPHCSLSTNAPATPSTASCSTNKTMLMPLAASVPCPHCGGSFLGKTQLQ